jgi:hypothetical protein
MHLHTNNHKIIYVFTYIHKCTCTTSYLLVEPACLWCLVLWLWDPRNWDASVHVLGVFGKLLKSRDACTWLHDIWTCSAKAFEYWMISSLKITLNHSWNFWRNWNVPLVLLERSCCWKDHLLLERVVYFSLDVGSSICYKSWTFSRASLCKVLASKEGITKIGPVSQPSSHAGPPLSNTFVLACYPHTCFLLSNLTKSSYAWLQFATQIYHCFFLLVNFRLISTWKIWFQPIQRFFFILKMEKICHSFQRKSYYDKFQTTEYRRIYFFPYFHI